MRRVKVDIHNHLQTSSDMSKIDSEKVINYAKQVLGPGGILGIVNMKDRRYEDFIMNVDSAIPTIDLERGDLYGTGLNNFLLVKCQEIATQQGHLLAIAMPKNESVDDGMSIEDTICEVKELEGIICVDHPFGWGGAGNYLLEHPKYLESGKIDAWETHNGETALYIPGKSNLFANKKSQRVYDKQIRVSCPVAELWSSDGHSVTEIGSSYTELLMPEDYQDIDLSATLKSAIKQTRFIGIEGKKTNSYVGAVRHAVALSGIIGMEKLHSRK
ncbi:MAG: hypothetical protein U9Q06_04060 [Nanoarchaeota archaeon]|nr:hypothetical protein [Nanoarchaeota archaeon]